MSGPTTAATPAWVASGGNNSNTLTTPSFTPANGEIIVVKMTTWDSAAAMNAPTGGSQTYTSRVIEAPGGFNGWCGIYTATISGSPGSMTISAAPATGSRHNMVVERWLNATLAASPVTAVSADGSGSFAAHGSLTTSAPNSAVSWCAVDDQSIDPSTRAYLNSAVEEGVDDGHVGANAVQYFGYHIAASQGSTSYGLSAPTGMKYDTAAIEILASGSSGPPIQVLVYNSAALAQSFNW